jgi:glycosyltransferase involved in cell wall biosynthesis
MKKLSLSLVVTTYNWPGALDLVLMSIRGQSMGFLEVIVADDGSDEKTAKVIREHGKYFQPSLIHSWQEDLGFRAARSRNLAIARARGDYIVMIDGDMVLHPHFIRDHIFYAQKGCFVQGVRAKMSAAGTLDVLTRRDIHIKSLDTRLKSKRFGFRSNVLSWLFSGTRLINKLSMIQTCNMAFFRSDCIAVNGFNEDFIGWGREDSEFGARLLHSGIKRKDLRFNAVAYHLHHEGVSRKMLEQNHQLFLATLKEKKLRCQNGIDKHMQHVRLGRE